MKNYKVRLTVTEVYDTSVQASNQMQAKELAVGMLNRGELETETGYFKIEMTEVGE